MEARKPDLNAQFLAVPDHLVAEILDGSLFTSARRAPQHASVASGLGAELHIPWQKGRGGPGGWWILDEPVLHLGAHIVHDETEARLPPFEAVPFDVNALWEG